MADARLQWYEFFAGGGLARLGLGRRWHCVFANEWSGKKASAYQAYFGASPELKVVDVASLSPEDLPGEPDLIWSSFPCQDLSLAGSGAGLDGERSGTFRAFWRLVAALVREGRMPRLIALENVVGALTSHSGKDFAAIIESFVGIGYKVGGLIIDAARFLPQSRPRLFLVGVPGKAPAESYLRSAAPFDPWHPAPLRRAVDSLPDGIKSEWLWWNLPVPNIRVPGIDAIIENTPGGADWHAELETRRILGLMGALHRNRVASMSSIPGRHVGTIYKRTRPDANGVMRQRAEVRFDGISGCLRTPVGGSSRQTVIVVDNGRIRTRLLSPREAARLMGVPDNYPLPEAYNEAYHIFGDGVAVPVVRWLEEHLLWPLARRSSRMRVA